MEKYLFGSASIIFTLAALAWAAQYLFQKTAEDERALENHGTRAKAEVLRHWRETRPDWSDKRRSELTEQYVYNVEYAFVTPSSDRFTSIKPLNQDDWDKIKEGDMIDIVYLHEKPEISRVGGARAELAEGITDTLAKSAKFLAVLAVLALLGGFGTQINAASTQLPTVGDDWVGAKGKIFKVTDSDKLLDTFWLKRKLLIVTVLLPPGVGGTMPAVKRYVSPEIAARMQKDMIVDMVHPPDDLEAAVMVLELK